MEVTRNLIKIEAFCVACMLKLNLLGFHSQRKLLDISCSDESQTKGDVWFIRRSLLSQTLQAALQGRDGGDEEEG